MQVHAYYKFRPVTAVLSVNYFDRFLSSHFLQVILILLFLHFPEKMPCYPGKEKRELMNFNKVLIFFFFVGGLQLANGWPLQLLSVACLSLAAKMEETQVPLLLDLQIFDPRFVFEPKTVQRMELRVMSVLNWRLNSITPFDYLHYFISKLPASSSEPGSFTRFLWSSSDLIIRTTRGTFIDPNPTIFTASLCFFGELIFIF